MTDEEGDINEIRSTEAEFDEEDQLLHLDYTEIDGNYLLLLFLVKFYV